MSSYIPYHLKNKSGQHRGQYKKYNNNYNKRYNKYNKKNKYENIKKTKDIFISLELEKVNYYVETITFDNLTKDLLKIATLQEKRFDMVKNSLLKVYNICENDINKINEAVIILNKVETNYPMIITGTDFIIKYHPCGTTILNKSPYNSLYNSSWEFSEKITRYKISDVILPCPLDIEYIRFSIDLLKINIDKIKKKIEKMKRFK